MAEGVGQVDCGSTPDLVRDALREKHRKCGNLENFPHTIPSMQFIDILQFYIFQPFLPCQGSLIEVRCCIKYQFSSER